MPESAPPSHSSSSGRWLAKDLSALYRAETKSPCLWDVLVVGSGYGGAMAAAELSGRLNESGQALKLAVLERGLEYVPGSFAKGFDELIPQVRVTSPNAASPTGRRSALFDLRLGADMSALVANGLGGGSLINAGVMERPKLGLHQSFVPDIDPKLCSELEALFDEVQCMLGGASQDAQGQVTRNTIAHLPEVQRMGSLQKTQALHALSPELFRLASITVATQDSTDAQGHPLLSACTLCGDCMTGCNVGAKQSLDTNLLRQAKQQGAHIYTGAAVHSFAWDDERSLWQVKVVFTDEALSTKHEPLILQTKQLILAAGSFGSTEILMRSHSEALQFSPQLGRKFSGNGDQIMAVHKLKEAVHAGAPEGSPLNERRVGPTITGVLDVPAVAGAHRGFLIQEFAVPAALQQIYAEVLSTCATVQSLDSADRSIHSPGTPSGDQADPCAVDPQAIERTAFLGVIGHDDAQGVLRSSLNDASSVSKTPSDSRSAEHDFVEGMLTVDWPAVKHAAELDAAHNFLSQQLRERDLLQVPKRDQMGAFANPGLIRNPLWRPLSPAMEETLSYARGPVLTVHPLGGCAIGSDVHSGVVNDIGLVWNAAPAASSTETAKPRTDWYGHLAVLDGSIMPGSLAANPALTIATLSLRASRRLAQQWAYTPSQTSDAGASKQTTLPPRPRARSLDELMASPAKACKPSMLSLSERLTGVIHLKNDPAPYWAELTLSYESVPISLLSENLYKPLRVIPTQGSQPTASSNGLPTNTAPRSRLRLFKLADWQAQGLIIATDTQRERWAQHRFSMSGDLLFLNREPSSSVQRRWRAWWAWLLNRGLRDGLQSVVENWGVAKPVNARSGLKRGLGLIASSIRLASRAGERRIFRYELSAIQEAPSNGLDAQLDSSTKPSAAALSPLRGHKRFTYGRFASPLRQLTELHLDDFPLPLDHSKKAILTLDGRYMAEQHWALLRVADQSNQVKVWQDLASLAGYMLRLCLSIHTQSFRRPDAGTGKQATLLPGSVKGLPVPEVMEWEIDRASEIALAGRSGVKGLPVLMRLTRYKGQLAAQGVDFNNAPLLLLHGYSASGSTFTHDAIPTSMASYFWRQGRDVWILDMRTSAGMLTSMARWRFEDAAWADIPLAVARIKALTGQSQIDVVAHCIGAVMLSMAVLTDDSNRQAATQQLGTSAQDTPARYWPEVEALPASIRRLVLSQKGPVLVYSNDNAGRGLLTRGLSRLLPEQWLFKNANDTASGNLFMGLIDRALNALPYSREEWQRENRLCFFPSVWPWRWRWHQPWVGFRHRMDMLYGRDFELARMSDRTLAACEDLFGPLNLETLNQTAHFVRDNVITNAAGHNVFVSPERMAKRWGLIGKTLSVHGEQNGLVDVATVGVMQKLMQQSGLAERYESEVFAQMGHQDSLIGKDAIQVFDRIEAFLQSPDVAQAEKVNAQPSSATESAPLATSTTNLLQAFYRLPYLGPAQLPRDVGNSTCAPSYALMCEPQYGSGQALLLAVQRNQQGVLSLDSRRLYSFWARNSANQALKVSSQAWSEAFQVPSPTPQALAEATAQAVEGLQSQVGYLVVLQHQRQAKAMHPELQSVVLDNLGLGRAPKAQNVWTALTQRYTANELALAYLPAEASSLPINMDNTSAALCFAFASCQYPAGLLDEVPAYASYARLAARLQRPREALRPQFLMLLGDQIYADASAGLVDPVRADDRYGQAYRQWLSQPAVRAVQQRLPSYMMLDDHEIQDNWEPHKPSVADDESTAPVTGDAQWLRACGLAAYWQYQRPGETPQPHAWRHFEQQSFGFFMCDTRSQRGWRHLGNLDSISILDDERTQGAQTLALEAWLKDQQARHGDQPKFVSSASLLLPLHVMDESDTLYADGWDGYPAALHRLLAFLYTHQIQNVVFLSGDEHLFCWTPMEVFAAASGQALNNEEHTDTPQAKIRAWSLHCPGLYAPLPFTNAKASQLITAQRFPLKCPSRGTELIVTYGTQTSCAQATRTHEGDGYVVLRVKPIEAENQTLAPPHSHARLGWQIDVLVDSLPTTLNFNFVVPAQI
jgi:cholesterol oxidase